LAAIALLHASGLLAANRVAQIKAGLLSRLAGAGIALTGLAYSLS
jgi:hypothetical protein